MTRHLACTNLQARSLFCSEQSKVGNYDSNTDAENVNTREALLDFIGELYSGSIPFKGKPPIKISQ